MSLVVTSSLTPHDPHDTRYQAVDFIETYTGRAFWPLSPKPEDVSIIDIAHSLSNQCRYSGATTAFYCPTLEQRVLTDDLKWVPAGDLEVGAGLLGFDEQPSEQGSTGRGRRRYRPATIQTTTRVRRRIIRLELSDGSTIRSAAEHPWLTSAKRSGNQFWLTAHDIKDAIDEGRSRYMRKFIEPWSFAATREAGWLAGLYDGEGYFSCTATGSALGVSQNPGAVLEHAKITLSRLGFQVTQCHAGSLQTEVLLMLGGWREQARLLGSVRPERLLSKFVQALKRGEFAKQMESMNEPLEIVDAFEEGVEWCAGLETSTHTYLCEGFGAHNSTAQHCCLLSNYVEKHMKGSTALDALQILMHDSAEAYLVDIPRPVKQHMPEYRKWDKTITMVIRSWLGIGDVPIPEWQDELDSRIIMDERAQLMSDSGLEWKHNLEPLGIFIDPWVPPVAEQQFLMRYAHFTKKIFGTHRYLRSGWGVPTHSVFQEFPFRTGGSDIAQKGAVDPRIITDLQEVDLLGGVGRVALRSPDGMMMRDTRAGTFPRPAWRWLHGRFDLVAPDVEKVAVVSTDTEALQQ